MKLEDWYEDIIKTVHHLYKYDINEQEDVEGMVFYSLARANFPQCVKNYPNCTEQSAYNYMFTAVIRARINHVKKMTYNTEHTCQLTWEQEQDEWYDADKEHKFEDLTATYYFDDVEFYDKLDSNFNRKEQNIILDAIRDEDSVAYVEASTIEVIKQRLIDVGYITEEESIERQRNKVKRKRRKDLK